MKRTFLIISFLIVSIVFGHSQRGSKGTKGPKGVPPSIQLKGQIIDGSTNKGLEYATISIYSKRDSSLIGGGLTDADGYYEVKATPAPVYAVTEYIGYEKQIIGNIEIDKEKLKNGQRNVKMNTIIMYPGGIALDEVEIRAEKSETQFSLDKRIFNVGKDLANKGGTAEDILDNVPSVTVDIEGEVSLRGSTGVRILINGRPSGLAGGGNANGLRSIPSNMIEKVEVITNPSARYEAEGMAGIINIILKKDTGSGFNGSFDASLGLPDQQGLGANLNYRKGKVNWFLNYGLNRRKNPGGGFKYQERIKPDTTFITDQTQDNNRGSLSNSIRFGIDYFLKENETLTGTFLYRKSDEENIGILNYRDYYNVISPGTLYSHILRTDDEEENESNLEYSVVYRNQIGGNRDHELTATVQYSDDLENEGSLFHEMDVISGTSTPTLLQRSNNDEGEKTWLFQVDYARPLGSKDHKFEIGMRSSLRTIGNDYLVEEQDENENWNSLAGLSNSFNYDEKIMALYAIYGNKFEKFSYQMGLRTEYSDVLTELEETSEINDRDYFDFFPSAHVNYELSEGSSVQLSYSRRIRRPRFWLLNPFFTFSDRRNFFSGNPNLDPEYTDSYELGYLKLWDKVTAGLSTFYRTTDNHMERILTINPDGTTFRRPVNLSRQNDFGLDVTMSYSGLEWLRLDANANFFRTMSDGYFEDVRYFADTYAWFGRMTTRITFWNNSDLQFRFNYRGPRETSQGTRQGRGSLDIGWSKDFLQNNLTLTLSGRDIFNTRRRAGETILEDFYENAEFQWRSRTVTLSANYRLNQKKKRKRGGQGRNEGGDEF